MVKPQTYYELYCDRCRKQLTDGDVTAYNSESDLMFVAGESEWKTIDGKHYCPNCYKVDEETDEYVPKKGGVRLIMNDQITMQKENILNAYVITNPYASGFNMRAVEIPHSTSADGWKYHKHNKRKK